MHEWQEWYIQWWMSKIQSASLTPLICHLLLISQHNPGVNMLTIWSSYKYWSYKHVTKQQTLVFIIHMSYICQQNSVPPIFSSDFHYFISLVYPSLCRYSLLISSDGFYFLMRHKMRHKNAFFFFSRNIFGLTGCYSLTNLFIICSTDSLPLKSTNSKCIFFFLSIPEVSILTYF